MIAAMRQRGGDASETGRLVVDIAAGLMACIVAEKLSWRCTKSTPFFGVVKR
jgi:translation initiation factor IF-2